MKRIRIICLLLALLLTGMALFSCGKGEEDEKNETKETDSAQTGTVRESDTAKETEEETVWYEPQRAKGKNYGGDDFTILTFPSDSTIYWSDSDFSATEITGDTIGDAVVQRNEYVSDLLGISLVIVPAANLGDITPVSNSVLSGRDDYQLAFQTTQSAFSLATNEKLIELHTMEDLQLDAPWWDQNSLTDLSILNQNYVLFGDIGVMYRKTIGVMLFNKEILDEHIEMPNPYLLVANREWTVEKLIDMAQGAYVDANADTVANEGDIFGLVYQGDGFPIAMMGSGVQFVSKDRDDEPYLSFNDERTIEVIDLLAEVFFDTSVARSSSSYDRPLSAGHAAEFESGRALFDSSELHHVIVARSMQQNFGVLPQPLFDEKQTSYYHCINPHVASTMVVPASNLDLSRTAIVADALSAAGKNFLDEAFYEITLQGRSVRDEESRISIEIAVNTVRYDIGYLSDWDISQVMMDMANRRSTDFVSVYRNNESTFQSKLEKTVEEYEYLAD